MRPLGYRRDPLDVRDHSAHDKLGAGPVPPAASARQYIVDVLDQGNASSCVANAILQAVRADHVRQGATAPALGSRLFGYYLSRAYHNETHVDGGTFLRTFFASLVKFGFCPETAWPYELDVLNKMPPADSFRLAFDQKTPTSYSRIMSHGAERILAIKRAIAAGHVVCFGTDIATDFFGDKGEVPIDPPTGMQIAGGHAMAVVSYNGDVFEICNSWGTGWGADGFCYFTADYLAWDGTWDLWICESAPPMEMVS
jgi:C1A family cysteine protease